MKLRTRITLIICTMIVILMFSLGSILYFKSVSIINKDSETLMVSQLDRVQENIDLLVNMNKLETKELSLDKKVEAFLLGKADVPYINKYLVNLMNNKNRIYNYYMDFFILDTSGHIIASCMPSAMNVDLSSRNYFIQSVKTKSTVTSDILVGRANGQPIVNTVSPIENLNGEILGYAGTAIYAEYFSKLAENLTLGKSGYYAIIDSNDLVLSHPNKDLIGKEFPFNINHKSFEGSNENLIKQTVTINPKEKEFQIFKLMKNTNWILIASLPAKDMYHKSKSFLYSVLIISIIALIFSLLIGVYVTNKISIPIVATTEYLNTISRSNSIIDKSISESIEILKNNYKEAHESNSYVEIKDNKYDEIGRFQKSFKDVKKTIYILLKRFEKESDQLIKSSKQLAITIEEISSGTGKFISTLSHELKNSITVIKGYSMGLKAGITQDEAVKAKFIDEIYNRTEEIETIISDVLDSAYEANKDIMLHKERLDLKIFALELAADASEYVKNKGLNLQDYIDIDDGILNVDKVKIKRVWNNLVSNAVKYSEAGSTVIIRISKQSNIVKFEIRDEGMGISEDDMQKIYNMFYRGTNVKQKGYGLGLFISKSIVEAHGGQINAKSELGKGSVFCFSINVDDD
ncbi:signal transduction histidine kinase [Clostridium pascui]|uniref:sensor histidine kinase n=1 Tax=Clostridium pascui TaxID=46609 RepID=UPI00195B7F39|nr:sensor histidine kinase [Clostridium pascui]MBM7868574.1 signal transduction histidine kinase [Clostridium pascui]